jgi:hypothetical protein
MIVFSWAVAQKQPVFLTLEAEITEIGGSARGAEEVGETKML